jgi:hypothetical protein
VTSRRSANTSQPERGITHGSYGASITSCVHDGRLYVFWTHDPSVGPTEVLMTSSDDGSNFGTASKISTIDMKSRPLGARAIAAVSAGQRMYVFFPRPNEWHENTLGVAWSDDGSTWAAETTTPWGSAHTVAACSYLDPAGPGRMMLGIVRPRGRVTTVALRYHSDGLGSKLRQLALHDHPEITTDYIAVAGGSVQGGGGGPTVQMFVNGEHGDLWIQTHKPTRRREFAVTAAGTWAALAELDTTYMRYPTWTQPVAFQFLVPDDKDPDHVSQEVWYAKTYQSSSISQPFVYFLRAPSDHMVRKATIKQYVPDTARIAVGVVEGPPPYLLNGKEFSKDVSSLECGRSLEHTVETTTTLKLGAFVKMGGSVGKAFKAGLTLSYDFARKNSQTETDKLTTSHTFYPQAGDNSAIQILARKMVVRREYQVSILDLPSDSPFARCHRQPE